MFFFSFVPPRARGRDFFLPSSCARRRFLQIGSRQMHKDFFKSSIGINMREFIFKPSKQRRTFICKVSANSHCVFACSKLTIWPVLRCVRELFVQSFFNFGGRFACNEIQNPRLSRCRDLTTRGSFFGSYYRLQLRDVCNILSARAYVLSDTGNKAQHSRRLNAPIGRGL